MNNILVNYDDATLVQRQYAFAAAVSHGYHTCCCSFWNAFMHPPISDERWFDEDGLIKAVVTVRFPYGQLEIPAQFNAWNWNGHRWILY